MADIFDPEKRSAVMRAVKSADTGPERIVRRLLHRMGLRFRLHRKDLPGKPDIVLARWKTVVFVHGCFWHGHDCARGARKPRTNAAYWRAKIDRNIARDAATGTALETAGWRVVTVWECETRKPDALQARLSEIFSDS